MRWNKPNVWSLDRTRDLLPLAMGSAIGIGNFLTIPTEVLYHGGLTVLLIHLLSVILLGGPLLIGEMFLGRWLMRPYTKAFSTIAPIWTWFPAVTLVALILITPPYLMILGRLLVLWIQGLSQGAPLSGSWELISQRPVASFLAAASVLFLSASVVQGGPARVARVMKGGLALCLLAFIFLSWMTLSIWGIDPLTSRLLSPRYAFFDFESALRVSTFSLFTLSAGLGVMYTFVFYASQPPLEEKPDDAKLYFQKPGIFPRIAAWIIVGDFLTSVVSLIWVSPFAIVAGPSSGDLAQESSATKILFDWIPNAYRSTSSGSFLVPVLLGVMLLAGWLAATTLIEFLCFSLEREMKWSRNKSLGHLTAMALVLLMLSSIPLVARSIENIGSDFLQPISCLGICLLVGWTMPRSAQKRLFGRSLLLDAWFPIWRFSVRFLVPGFLIYLIAEFLRRKV